MSNVHFLVIGDPHIQIKNFQIIQVLIERVKVIIDKIKPDAVVILGDTLHSHEKVDSRCLNMSYKLVDEIRKKVPCFLLIGNHDYIHNKVFLTNEHAFNALKEWENVYVIDTPRSFTIGDYRFVFCPYVEDGRLQEALSLVKPSIKQSPPKCIFCHATFKGAILDNGTVSTLGESSDDNFYCSGHIHKTGWIKSNVFYPGTPYQTSFGEDDKKGIYSMTFTDEQLPKIQRIDLLLQKKKVIQVDVNDIDSVSIPEDANVKVIVTGDISTIKEKKKKIEQVFGDCHIQMKPNSYKATTKYKGKRFHEVLSDLIKENELAMSIHNECLV